MKHFLSICLLLLLASSSFAATGRVSGRVVNKTNGQGVAGLEVRLVRPGEKGQDKSIGTVKSGPDGQFAFGPFQVGAEDIYMAQSQWQGFKYETVAYDGTGHLKEMGITVDPAKVELPVFDVTRQAPEITFTAHHLALETEEKALKVTERIVAQNSSKLTFIGDDKGTTIKLDIPASAKNVSLDERTNGKLIKTADGYAVAKPITPADYQRRNAIIVNYNLEWPVSAPWDRKIDLSKKIFYPTKFFFVARNPDEKGMTLSAPQLGPERTEQIPGQEGPMMKVVNDVGAPMSDKPALKAGESVAITLGRPVNPLVWAFVMFLVALIAIVPFALRGGKNPDVTAEDNPSKIKEPSGAGVVLAETFRSPEAENATSPNMGNGFAMSGDAQELLLAIARLDEEFAQGAVDKETYEKRRADWKRQLTQLLS